MDDIAAFKATFGLRDEDVLLVPFGSRVYGTHAEDSDHDYIAVVPAGRRRIPREYMTERTNILVYNARAFQAQLHKHEIDALEAFFHPDGACRGRFTFRLRPRRLRNALLRKASHSWVRAKKKMLLAGDARRGCRSLFHALRILQFGVQIATQGRIADYGAANGYWFEIRDAAGADWAYFEGRYRPSYNALASALRRATAPAGGG
jgi:hypothetical protein